MYAYDVDGDGDNDVITSLEAHGWGLAWYEQQKDERGGIAFKAEPHLIIGSRHEDNPYGVRFSQLHAVELADVDGDGFKDIITGKCRYAHGPGGDPEPKAAPVLYWFRLVRGAGGVEWIPYRIDDNSGIGRLISLGDANRDGLVDIVIGNKRGTYVFLQEKKRVSRADWEQAQPKKIH
jgi:hypothetical protein